MHHFGGYRLGCAGCTSGSWSDLSKVIGCDHFLNVCPDSCRDRMLYSIVCCYLFYHRLCLTVVEDHIDSAAFFWYSSCFDICAFFIVCHRMHSSWSLSWWLDQLLYFDHQKGGKNTCEIPMQNLSVGLGASIFTFVKTCLESYGL
jgi:hypothetical protein